MIIDISKDKVIIRKSDLTFVLVNYGTREDLARRVSAWIEAEMRLRKR